MFGNCGKPTKVQSFSSTTKDILAANAQILPDFDLKHCGHGIKNLLPAHPLSDLHRNANALYNAACSSENLQLFLFYPYAC
jgi:hypothetical protein